MSKCHLVQLKINESLKKICYVLAEWIDGQRGTNGQLTVSFSAFAKEEYQQLPDEPHPGEEK